MIDVQLRAGERMSSFDDPIDIVRNVGEEFTSVASFKTLEDIANLRMSYRLASFPVMVSGILRASHSRAGKAQPYPGHVSRPGPAVARASC